ncbi:MAG: hypothetical protein ACRDX8_04865 [Acidimicrobiales bacterium]
MPVADAFKRQRGEDGIVALNITLFVALALAAVILLTATTVSAISINRHVRIAIQPPISRINADLSLLPILNKVDASAAQIQADLNHGNGQTVSKILQGVITDTNHVNSSVKSILANVNTIHTSVVAIHGKVANIGSDVSSIAGSVGTIHNSFVGINSDVGSIASGAVTINNNVDAIISPVTAIHADTGGKILPLVGTINASANGIDCAILIMGSACGHGGVPGTSNSGGGGSGGGGLGLGGLLNGLGL